MRRMITNKQIDEFEQSAEYVGEIKDKVVAMVPPYPNYIEDAVFILENGNAEAIAKDVQEAVDDDDIDFENHTGAIGFIFFSQQLYDMPLTDDYHIRGEGGGEKLPSIYMYYDVFTFPETVNTAEQLIAWIVENGIPEEYIEEITQDEHFVDVYDGDEFVDSYSFDDTRLNGKYLVTGLDIYHPHIEGVEIIGDLKIEGDLNTAGINASSVQSSNIKVTNLRPVTGNTINFTGNINTSGYIAARLPNWNNTHTETITDGIYTVQTSGAVSQGQIIELQVMCKLSDGDPAIIADFLMNEAGIYSKDVELLIPIQYLDSNEDAHFGWISVYGVLSRASDRKSLLHAQMYDSTGTQIPLIPIADADIYQNTYGVQVRVLCH